jgi:hypothetical protein
MSCLELGMNMFTIDSLDVEKSLYSYLKSNFLSMSSSAWINGRRDPFTKEWHYYGDSKIAIPSRLSWRNGQNTNIENDCMTADAMGGYPTFKVDGNWCPYSKYSICEFRNASLAPLVKPTGEF